MCMEKRRELWLDLKFQTHLILVTAAFSQEMKMKPKSHLCCLHICNKLYSVFLQTEIHQVIFSPNMLFLTTFIWKTEIPHGLWWPLVSLIDTVQNLLRLFSINQSGEEELEEGSTFFILFYIYWLNTGNYIVTHRILANP